ncbi:MAG: hypothetical protein C0403_04780 [Desulfobacterium sp.]|nr:hypothetical protein [Desulfobacterium sp.]
MDRMNTILIKSIIQLKINNLVRIRRRNVVFGTFILIAVVLFVGHRSFELMEQATFKDFNQHQLILAKEAASGIEMFFENLSGALKILGNIPEINHFDEKITRQLLKHEIHELKRFCVNDIGILDTKGILRFSAEARELEGKEFSWRNYYQKAKQMLPGSSSYIIEFIEFKGVDVGQKGIVVAVPMFKNEPHSETSNFVGIILCTLKLDSMNEKLIAQLKPSANGHAFLIDHESNILWMPDRKQFGGNLLQNAEAFPSFRRTVTQMLAGSTDMTEIDYYRFDESTAAYTEEKETKLLAFVPISLGEMQWSVGIWAPKMEVRERIHDAYINHLLLVGIIIITLLVASAYIIVISLNYNKSLKEEVALKTTEFKDSHERLLTILDGLDAMVFVADIETYDIFFANKYLRDQFGDVIGRPCWQALQSGQTGPCKFCSNSNLLGLDGLPTGARVWEVQNTINNQWYIVYDRAISWVDGRIVRLEIATDITDRKNMEEELRQAHKEMGTFCQIIKQVSGRQTLGSVGAYLLNELRPILNTNHMQMFIFSSDRNSFFSISEKNIAHIENPEMVQTILALLEGLNDLIIAPAKPFIPPLIPDTFPTKGRQSIIPILHQNQLCGVLVVACPKECLCPEKGLEMAALILAQTAGAITRAAFHEEEVHELHNRIEHTAEFRGIIGKDPKMQVIYKLIEDIAPTDASVLIQGESGTGKELVARAIHNQSPRNNKPFIVINCSAYPETLLESELFGHEKGAFTGAVRQKTGRFEQAHGGTVFLDEIGEISPSAQIKLLRVLQTHKFERLGGEQTISVDIRLLAATNKELLQEVKNGNFREDLFYRLNVIPVHLPALKTRRNDIPLLARHFQQKFSTEQGVEIRGFSSDTMRRLLEHPWPGNVRELENSIEHAVVIAKGGRIEISHLPNALSELPSSLAGSTHGTMLENEKRLLMEILQECDWNKKQAAQQLGISRSTLYAKLKKYRIKPPLTHAATN